MGINYILFDDVDSRTYNIEVFFNDIDRTPKRVYTRVDVAGRNGSILLDEGRYEDVPITYDCIALDDADRRDFVNALASKVGYFRLSDSFNTDEYYSAVFDGDIEPRLTPERNKSTFSIYFTRYPQRWLTAGETQSSVARNAKINNPTPFDAKPLVMVHGYGTINIGDYEIELDDGSYGTITITYGDSESAGSASNTRTMTLTKSYASYAGMVNVGDPLYMERANTVGGVYRKSGAPRISTVDGVAPPSDLKYNWSVNILEHTFTAFPSQDEVATNTTTHAFVLSNNTSFNSTITLTVTNKPTGVIEFTSTLTTTVDISANFTYGITNLSTDTITLESSISTVGDPTYIDCDIGEAYLIDGSGNVVSLNSLIELGSDLPVLSPGDTTITYDNTITAVEIIPRWWIL